MMKFISIYPLFRIAISVVAASIAFPGHALQIKSFDGFKCLDAAGFGTSNGTKIQQWECHGGANQHWQITPSGNILGYGNKCMALIEPTPVDGTAIHLWDCNDNSEQKWYLSEGKIVPLNDPTRCLVVSDSGNSDGAIVYVFNCALVSMTQRWRIY